MVLAISVIVFVVGVIVGLTGLVGMWARDWMVALTVAGIVMFIAGIIGMVFGAGLFFAHPHTVHI